MRSSSRRRDAGVARHELIGLEVQVEAQDGFHGISGKVVDETKHTFLVERTSGPEVVVPKTGHDFVFRVGSARFVVRGDDIQFRPEDRTKKVRR